MVDQSEVNDSRNVLVFGRKKLRKTLEEISATQKITNAVQEVLLGSVYLNLQFMIWHGCFLFDI